MRITCIPPARKGRVRGGDVGIEPPIPPIRYRAAAAVALSLGRSRRLPDPGIVVRLPDTAVDVSPTTPPPPPGESPAPASVSSPFSSPGEVRGDGCGEESDGGPARSSSSSVDIGYTLGRSSTYSAPPGKSLRSSRRRSSASSESPGKVAASRRSPASSSECSRLRVASALAAFFISTSRLRRRHAGASLSISSASPGSGRCARPAQEGGEVAVHHGRGRGSRPPRARAASRRARDPPASPRILARRMTRTPRGRRARACAPAATASFPPPRSLAPRRIFPRYRYLPAALVLSLPARPLRGRRPAARRAGRR